jgi:hypothetical protein
MRGGWEGGRAQRLWVSQGCCAAGHLFGVCGPYVTPTPEPACLPSPRRRFPGRSHHCWLEPEGLGSHVVYPNGISNSLEPEDQLRLLATIPGGRSGGGGGGVRCPGLENTAPVL